MDVDLTTLGTFYIVWIPTFWAAYILLSRRLHLSIGYLVVALVVQFVPLLGVVFLMMLLYFCLKRDHEGAKIDPYPNCRQ